MKGKASKLKQIISMVTSLTRDKCVAIRSKTDTIKARLMVTAFTLLSKRNKLSIDGLFRHRTEDVDDDADDDDASRAIVLYANQSSAGGAISGAEASNCVVEEFDNDDDDKYPDLRHSLFEEEEEKELAQLLDDPSSAISAIDIVKNAKDQDGEKFNLEDEINEVADLFITKFHKRMRLQKLLSFKRHQQIRDGNES